MMTLNEYYKMKPVAIYPRTDMVDGILKECEADYGEGCVSRATVQNWCNGDTKPNDSKFLKSISRATGIPEEDLFG